MPESFSVDVVGVRRLGELFSCVRSESECVAWSDDQSVARRGISFVQFEQDVADLAAHFAVGDNTGNKWALYCEDSYQFLVGLMAMLHCDITPVLPMNIQPGVIDALAQRIDGFVSDVELLSDSMILLPLLSDQALSGQAQ